MCTKFHCPILYIILITPITPITPITSTSNIVYLIYINSENYNITTCIQPSISSLTFPITPVFVDDLHPISVTWNSTGVVATSSMWNVTQRLCLHHNGTPTPLWCTPVPSQDGMVSTSHTYLTPLYEAYHHHHLTLIHTWYNLLDLMTLQGYVHMYYELEWVGIYATSLASSRSPTFTLSMQYYNFFTSSASYQLRRRTTTTVAVPFHTPAPLSTSLATEFVSDLSHAISCDIHQILVRSMSQYNHIGDFYFVSITYDITESMLMTSSKTHRIGNNTMLLPSWIHRAWYLDLTITSMIMTLNDSKSAAFLPTAITNRVDIKTLIIESSYITTIYCESMNMYNDTCIDRTIPYTPTLHTTTEEFIGSTNFLLVVIAFPILFFLITLICIRQKLMRQRAAFDAMEDAEWAGRLAVEHVRQLERERIQEELIARRRHFLKQDGNEAYDHQPGAKDWDPFSGPEGIAHDASHSPVMYDIAEEDEKHAEEWEELPAVETNDEPSADDDDDDADDDANVANPDAGVAAADADAAAMAAPATPSEPPLASASASASSASISTTERVRTVSQNAVEGLPYHITRLALSNEPGWDIIERDRLAMEANISAYTQQQQQQQQPRDSIEGYHPSERGEDSVSHHVDACEWDIAYAYWLHDKEEARHVYKDEHDAYDDELRARAYERDVEHGAFERSTTIAIATSHVVVYPPLLPLPSQSRSPSTSLISWNPNPDISHTRLHSSQSVDHMSHPPRLLRTQSDPQHYPSSTSYLTPTNGSITSRHSPSSFSVSLSRTSPQRAQTHRVPFHSPILASLPDTDPDDVKQISPQHHVDGDTDGDDEITHHVQVGEVMDRIMIQANDEGMVVDEDEIRALPVPAPAPAADIRRTRYSSTPSYHHMHHPSPSHHPYTSSFLRTSISFPTFHSFHHTITIPSEREEKTH